MVSKWGFHLLINGGYIRVISPNDPHLFTSTSVSGTSDPISFFNPSRKPSNKTKARLGIHEDMLKEPRRFLLFFSNHLVQCNVSRTLRELMWEDGLAEQMFSLLCNIVVAASCSTHLRLKGSLAGLMHSDEVQRFKEEKKAMSINWKDSCKKPWTQKNDN